MTFKFTTPRRPYRGPMEWGERPTCETCSDFRPIENPLHQFNVGGIVTVVELGECKGSMDVTAMTPKDNKACLNHSKFRKE